MNHYDTLGIAPTADAKEIKAAWRKLSSLYHPDREGGSAEKMAGINKAYEVLGDPLRRANYDDCGQDEIADPIEVKAREALLVVFMQCVEHAEDHVNLIRDTERMLLQHRGDHQQVVSDCRKGLKKLNERKARLSKKNGGDNFLVAAIEQRAAGLTDLMEKNADQCRVIDKARELAKDYDYATPTADQIYGTSFAGRNTGATIGHIAYQWPEGS